MLLILDGYSRHFAQCARVIEKGLLWGKYQICDHARSQQMPLTAQLTEMTTRLRTEFKDSNSRIQLVR